MSLDSQATIDKPTDVVGMSSDSNGSASHFLPVLNEEVLHGGILTG
jgi:hypothetical protein